MDPSVGELFNSYCEERQKFLKPQYAIDYVSDHVDKLTKGHEYLSKKYIAKINGVEIFEHYKMKQTYMQGTILCKKKKPPRFALSMCHYIKKTKGTVYYIRDDRDEQMLILSAHFFNRLNERLLERNGEREAFDEVIRIAMVMTQESHFYVSSKPLLLEEESFQAYYIFKEGYGAGEYMKFKADKEVFPRNESGTITAVFLKTYLTDAEISPEKMDRLVELYRRNKDGRSE